MKQVDSSLPTIEELKRLPLRAMVALAVRNVLRLKAAFILPKTHVDATMHEQALNHVVAVVEEFANSTLRHELCEPARKVAIEIREATKVAEQTNALQAKLVGMSAYLAAIAVFAATFRSSDVNEITVTLFRNAQPNQEITESDIFLAGAEHTIQYVAQSLQFSAALSPATLNLIVSDYEKLTKLTLGNYPNHGTTVDVSERGELGSLWPEGAPTWYAPDNSHPFYEEILQFFVSFTTLKSLLITSELHKVHDSPNTKSIDTPEGSAFLAVVPDLRIPTIISEHDCDEQCELYPAETVNYLLGSAGQPAQLWFITKPFVNKVFPQPEDVQVQIGVHLGASVKTIVH